MTTTPGDSARGILKIPPPPSPSFVFEIDAASPSCRWLDSLAEICAEALANRAGTASMNSDEDHISGVTTFCMSAPRSWK